MSYDEAGMLGLIGVAFILAYLGKNNDNPFLKLFFIGFCFTIFLPLILGYSNQIIAVQNNTDASNNLDITALSNVNLFGFSALVVVGIPVFLLLIIIGLYFDLFTAPLNQWGSRIRDKLGWEGGWRK